MEMVIVLAILSLLAAMATPYARMSIKREKEIQLRETLRTVRIAIDRFHADFEGAPNKRDSNYISENGFPLSLQVLVDGVEKAAPPDKLAGNRLTGGDGLGSEDRLTAADRPAGRPGEKKKKRYLRSLPQNPFAPAGTPFEEQWTFVGYLREAPLLASSSYGTTLAEARKSRQDIYDLHAVTQETAIDGTRYADW
jgi:general secretion pathway protein G